MRQPADSLLHRGMTFPRWLLRLTLLITLLLSYPRLSATTLPEGTPDYEFTRDNVTYKYYYDNSENDGRTEAYKVFAVPGSQDIKFASIRLYWNSAVSIPGTNGIYRYGLPTILPENEWSQCSNLKTVELITGIPGYGSNAVSNDLYELGKCTSLSTIVITGQAYGNWTLCNIPSGVEIFSDLGSTISGISDFNVQPMASLRFKLLKCSDNYGMSYYLDLENCEKYALTPTLKITTVNPSEYKYAQTYSEITEYEVPFDSDGNAQFPVSWINEAYCTVEIPQLKGVFNQESWTYKENSITNLGWDFDWETYLFDIEEKNGYIILKPDPLNLPQLGFTGCKVWEKTGYSRFVEITEDNGCYYIPTVTSDNYTGTYYIELLSDQFNQFIYFGFDTMLSLGIESLKWTIYSAEFRLTNNSTVSDEGVIYGMAEVINNEVVQFVPFEDGIAYLEDFDKRFEVSYYSGWSWKNNMTCYLYAKIDGQLVRLSDSYSDGYGSRETFTVDPLQLNMSFSPDTKLNELPEGFTFGLIWSELGNTTTTEGSYNPSMQWGGIDIRDLLPGTSYTLQLYVEINGEQYTSNTFTVKTTDIETELTASGILPQSATITGNVTTFIANAFRGYGNFDFSDIQLTVGDETYLPDEATGDATFHFSGLPVNTKFEVVCNPYYERLSDGTRVPVLCTALNSSTIAPKWIDGTSEALTTTKARLKYSTDLESASDSYIEWRRVDAPDVIQSQTATCPVVDGSLIGVLNNLNPDVYYQYRPVYKCYAIGSQQEQKYIGEWVGIFTGDANVWFDPEVGTAPARVRNDGSVTLSGSVLPGSGDVSGQGFELWGTSDESAVQALHQAPANPRVIPCEGISLSVDLTDLTGGEYAYRTFAIVDGTYFYGDEQTFSIPGMGSVEGVAADTAEPEIVGYYNLQGVFSDTPRQGLNIVIYSNGKTEKRVIRDL